MVAESRMVRNKNQIIGKSPCKKSKITASPKSVSGGSADNENSSPENELGPRLVNKQNSLYIVSFPVIFVFNILRSLLYQLFIIFRYIYTTTTRIIYKPVKRKECGLEIVINNTSTEDNKSPLIQNSAAGSNIEMANIRPGPGPGDPLLAKQKHHHRRAFEYISKALKIDEENEGNVI